MSGLPFNLSLKGWENASSLQSSVLDLLVTSYYYISASRVNELRMNSAVEGPGYMTAEVPRNQWVTEARNIEAATWAAMQINIADYAIGPGVRTPDLKDYVGKPETKGDQQLCRAQKMRKSGGFV